MFLPGPQSGQRDSAAHRMTIVEALREALREEMPRDERVSYG